MAGIGFRLRDIVTRRTFSEWVKLYLYSAVVFAGPWLFSIICLGLLTAFAVPEMQGPGIRLFTVTVVYAFAFSLVTTGAIQFVVTRYVADRLFVKDRASVVPAFVGSATIVAGVQVVVATLFLYGCGLSFAYKLTAMTLYVVMSVMWLMMIFLGAAKDYGRIVLSFAVGYALSFGLARLLGPYLAVEGYLIGFLAGQVVVLFMLLHRLLREFPMEGGFHFRFFQHYRLYPSLVFIGIAYNLAIWIDKFIFWFSAGGLHIHSIFYTHFPYDSAMFFGYLTIIPTLVIFLVRIETEFYIKYKAYYGGIKNKDPYHRILERKDDMEHVLRTSVVTAALYQGIFTVGIIVAMPWVLDVLDLDRSHVALFRFACLGAAFNVYLLILSIVLLYYDFRGAALVVSLAFLALNTALTVVSLTLGQDFHGLGYVFAAGLSLILGLALLSNRLGDLEFLTFVRQPIVGQRVLTR